MAEAARKFGVAEQPLYREAPNNIEAEQALLGAILVNNDAFYRVSDFLKSGHFYEPLHRKIFEVAAELIRMGKMATPITLKTFLPADEKVGDMTVAQYVVRLAVEAVTVVNAADYGRAIYDLATRRALITVGEDMVNIAYDAPVDMSPSEQIEDAERRLFELAETGRYDGGFESFTDAVKTAVDMANAAYMRDGHLSGIATGLRDLDRRMGGLQPSDLIIIAGRPGMGKTSLATNMAFNIAEAYVAGAAGRRLVQGGQWRRRRLLLARNVVGTARHPYHFRTDRNPVVENPPRRDHARWISKSWSPVRRPCRRSRCSSTRPAAFRSRSCRRARVA